MTPLIRVLDFSHHQNTGARPRVGRVRLPMTPLIRVLDFSHHQNTGARPRVASTDFAAVKAAGAAAVVIRTNYGLRVDDLVVEHNRRADAAALPRMFYWYPLTRKDPTEQATQAFQLSGATPGRRGWIDLEENARSDGADPAWPRYSHLYFEHADIGLLAADVLSGMLTGVYSSKTYLDYWFTPQQQARWANRFGWWAHYNPTITMPWIPAGWINKARPYEMWQDQIAPWPGCKDPVDQERLWPGLTIEELLGTGAPPVVVPPAVDPLAAAVSAHARAIQGLVV
jgi:hypothetical protein